MMTLSSLLLRGVTWQRDSHGLFDYESRQITQKSFKTQSNCKLVRQGHSLELSQLSKCVEDQAKALFQIRYD